MSQFNCELTVYSSSATSLSSKQGQDNLDNSDVKANIPSSKTSFVETSQSAGFRNVDIDFNASAEKKLKKYNINHYLPNEIARALSCKVVEKSNQILLLLSEFEQFEKTCLIVNSLDENEILLEWFYDDKDLSVYVTPDAIEYIKSWGSNIHSEMKEDILSNPSDIRDLWIWLTTS